jgi:hypothetical protein
MPQSVPAVEITEQDNLMPKVIFYLREREPRERGRLKEERRDFSSTTSSTKCSGTTH